MFFYFISLLKPFNTFVFFSAFCQKRLASFFPIRMMCHHNSYQSEESTVMTRDGEEYYERTVIRDISIGSQVLCYAQTCRLYRHLSNSETVRDPNVITPYSLFRF